MTHTNNKKLYYFLMSLDDRAKNSIPIVYNTRTCLQVASIYKKKDAHYPSHAHAIITQLYHL